MFGLGGTEIIIIIVIALIFLGPDKLPEAAAKISRGIRDLRKQTRVLQDTIEQDERIGGALRDLRSALHDDPLRLQPPPRAVPPPARPLPTPQLHAPPTPASDETAPTQAADETPVLVAAADTVAKGSHD